MSGMSDTFLGSAAKARGKMAGINTITVVLAMVLAVGSIATRNNCINDDDATKYKNGMWNKIIYYSSIIILIFSIVLFLYDMGIRFDLIK